MPASAPPPAPLSWWDRHVVPRLIGLACTQAPIMRRRAALVPRAHGRVLEYGVGGGANLAFYDPARVESVTGIDPSPPLLARARAAPRAAVPVVIEQGVAEALPFADASFDTVVTTFTLCSVADQAQALAEARRVLKPGGTLLFLEHGLSPDPGPCRWQHRLEPLWKRVAGGCHLTRPVADAIAGAGFRVTDVARGYMETSPRFLGWIESGSATPA
ncbi:class I SAM-dependent methyltransferase [Thermaurantiacus tibetensis]|uniref:class I SAM-dependent methyltransferase n=1 Tax=Thermaurantiacus tibetensis TaxID=2759035 RepID=UPI002E2AF683|nr:class I SAM-dependent methyltransferase [Thermaurantiacus tibetensis]